MSRDYFSSVYKMLELNEKCKLIEPISSNEEGDPKSQQLNGAG